MIELLLALQLATSVPVEQETKLGSEMKWLLGAYIGASGADKTITAHCIGKGTCRELNPLFQWIDDKPATWGLVTMSAHAGIGYLALRVYKKNKIAGRILLVTLTGISAAAAIHNHRQLNK